MIAFIFQSHGFEVELTPVAKDGGRDIVAVQRSLGVLTRWLVECKRYAITHKVGVELVRQLYGVLMSEQANKAILVTTSGFTAGAREFAERHPWPLTLRDGPGVLNWANATAV
jgi:HJR/Mrr/RecB family endonuclease